MQIQEKSKLMTDIEKLIAIGVMKIAIAESMGLSKQAFSYRYAIGRFTIDQSFKFYKKYRNAL
jgi:hypothetical protein